MVHLHFIGLSCDFTPQCHVENKHKYHIFAGDTVAKCQELALESGWLVSLKTGFCLCPQCKTMFENGILLMAKSQHAR